MNAKDSFIWIFESSFIKDRGLLLSWKTSLKALFIKRRFFLIKTATANKTANKMVKLKISPNISTISSHNVHTLLPKNINPVHTKALYRLDFQSLNSHSNLTIFLKTLLNLIVHNFTLLLIPFESKMND